MNINMGVFPPLLAPSKMNLELPVGRGAASPHLKPLSGLANPSALVSPWALPSHGQDPVSRMANVYGSQARKGPARWSCICFASRYHSSASSDSTSLYILPK